MTPTGSWPMVKPRATGYSPLRMCTSVPQMVVVVTLISASKGPTSGTGLSSSTMRPGSTKIAAFIIMAMVGSCLFNGETQSRQTGAHRPDLRQAGLTRVKDGAQKQGQRLAAIALQFGRQEGVGPCRALV